MKRKTIYTCYSIEKEGLSMYTHGDVYLNFTYEITEQEGFAVLQFGYGLRQCLVKNA